jgi:hypothetical protein
MDERLNQLTFLTRALQSADVWLAVAYVGGMFAVAGFRPQNIASGVLFRLSFIAFGVALVIPALADGLVTLVNLGNSSSARKSSSNSGAAWPLVSMLGHLFGKGVFAVAIVLGLASLQVGAPRPELPRARPVERSEKP